MDLEINREYFPLYSPCKIREIFWVPTVFEVLTWVPTDEISLFSRRLQSGKNHSRHFLEDEEEGARMRTYRCMIPSLARQHRPLK